MLAPTTLILGLGRDVGTACARYFQEHGHNIVLASPDEAALQRSSEELMRSTRLLKPISALIILSSFRPFQNRSP